MRSFDCFLLALVGFLVACQPNAPRSEANAAGDSVARPAGGSGAAALPASGAADAPLTENALFVGFMRWDGSVAPFGAFDGVRWRGVDRESFDRLFALGPTWTFTSREGNERRIRGEDVAEAPECRRMHESWIQTTAFRPDTIRWSEFFDSTEQFEWAGRGCPMARIGLAVSGRADFIPMATTDAPGHGRLGGAIRTAFEETEAGALEGLRRDSADRSRTWSGHPVSAEARGRRPIEITTLQHAPAFDERGWIYYFDAVRRYEPIEQNGRACDTETRVNGFVVQAGSEYAAVAPTAGIRARCVESPGQPPRRVRPWGVLEAGDHHFFIATTARGEGSAPTVYELTRAALRPVLRGWQ